mmetsp:Transcript_10883/g.7599  ORF Transcript_10883/g.7599 Transcript_10883/m.7599 type:complete len:331 (+) Transcript_10883:163-1155(+)
MRSHPQPNFPDCILFLATTSTSPPSSSSLTIMIVFVIFAVSEPARRAYHQPLELGVLGEREVAVLVRGDLLDGVDDARHRAVHVVGERVQVRVAAPDQQRLLQTRRNDACHRQDPARQVALDGRLLLLVRVLARARACIQQAPQVQITPEVRDVVCRALPVRNAPQSPHRPGPFLVLVHSMDGHCHDNSGTAFRASGRQARLQQRSENAEPEVVHLVRVSSCDRPVAEVDEHVDEKRSLVLRIVVLVAIDHVAHLHRRPLHDIHQLFFTGPVFGGRAHLCQQILGCLDLLVVEDDHPDGGAVRVRVVASVLAVGLVLEHGARDAERVRRA